MKMSNWNTILNRTKKIGETASAFIPIIKLILTASGVMGIFFLTSSYIDKNRQLDDYVQQVAMYEQGIALANQFSDSLAEQIEYQEKRSEEALERVSELSEAVETLNSERQELTSRLNDAKAAVVITDTTINSIIEIQDSIIENQDSVIVSQETEIEELNTVIQRKDLSIYYLTESVDSLQTVISDVPAPQTEFKVFGLFEPPDRTIVAIASFIGGLIVAGQLAK